MARRKQDNDTQDMFGLSEMTLTDEQRDCMEKFTTGRKLRINAFAGTGKTSTLVALAKDTRRLGVYLTFNRDMKLSAEKKFPKNVKCSTTHSMAYVALEKRIGKQKLYGAINGRILSEKLSLEPLMVNGVRLSPTTQGATISKALHRWHLSDRAVLLESDIILPRRLHATTGGDKEKQQFRRDMLTQAVEIWRRQCNPSDPTLPLPFDAYVKLWALQKPRILGDFIFLDEAQDTNPVIMGVLKDQAQQLVCVGDRYQSIYEWRGAVNAMTELPVELDARLTTSFRFGPAIADYASSILRTLGESTPLTGIDFDSRLTEIENPDVILCRTNATLIDYLIEAMAVKKMAAISGGTGELMQYVKAAGDLMRGNAVEEPAEFFGFENWSQVVEESETEDGEDLVRWVKLFAAIPPEDLRQVLKELPKEADADVILSTAHKAKGREWRKVKLADDFLLGVKSSEFSIDAIKPELRLLYVAVTRAQEQLDVPRVVQEKLRIIKDVMLRPF